MRVVNCKKETYTHYIGRPGTFGNPFSHRSNTRALWRRDTREEAISAYEKYARDYQELMDAIRDLPEDSVLGCWCKPQSCHGDVIMKLWEELHGVLGKMD